MATREQLLEGLRRADAAGNAEDAQRFASMLKALPADESERLRGLPPPTPVNVSGDMPRAMREEMGSRSWLANNLAAAGNALRGPWEGAKQILGIGDRQNAEAVRTMDQEAPTGAIVGNVGAMLLPGMQGGGVVKAAALGGGIGALQPTIGDEERSTNAALGAAGGVAGNVAARTLGRVLSPRTSDAVKALDAEGVRLTPGQIAGGAFQRVEDAATSIPFAGDVIRAAKVRATGDLNRAAYNRVLAPLGEKVGKNFPVGREGVEEVSKRVSDAYQDLLPKLNVAQDATFTQRLGTLRRMARTLPPERATQFENILDEHLLSRFTPAGLMSGETMKQADSTLGRLSATYRSSADADQRQMGAALRQVQEELRGMVARNNPAEAPKLAAINKAYANLMRVESAAGTLGAKDGVFSAAQLSNRVRAGDKSLNKRQFAHGNALMQDLADAGKDVLGQKVPDSGTPFRLMNIAGVSGAPFLDPSVLGIAGALGAAYTPPVQAVLRAAMLRRPEALRAAGAALPALGAPAGATLPWLAEQ